MPLPLKIRITIIYNIIIKIITIIIMIIIYNIILIVIIENTGLFEALDPPLPGAV